MRISVRKLQGNWAPSLVMAITVFVAQSLVLVSVSSGQIVFPAQSDTPSTSEPTAEPLQTQSAAGTPQSWLNRAKHAMDGREYDLAEHYIQIADELYQQQSATNPLHYTPAMARQDLQYLQGQAAGTIAQVAAQMPVADQESTQPKPMAFPPVVQANGMNRLPAPTATPPKVTESDRQVAAKTALFKARQFLAHGKVAQAESMMNYAKQFAVDFTVLGDSPQTVQAMIDQQNHLASLKGAEDSSYNDMAAKFLLQQSEALIGYQDYENAKMLVEQAKSFPVQFTPAIGNPDQLLSVISAAATQAASATDTAKSSVMKVLSQAQLAMDQGNWPQAKTLIQQAKSYNVPDSAFAADETRPWQLELQVDQALSRQNFGSPNVIRTNFEEDASKVVTADYDPSNDATRNIQVALTDTGSESEDRVANLPEFSPIPSRGMQLYRSGLQALDNSDHDRAQEYFQMAWRYQEDLDTQVRQSIQDHLQNLSTPPAGVATAATATEPAATATSNGQDPFSEPVSSVPSVPNLPAAAPAVDRETQQATFRRLQSEVFRERASAERMLETRPRQALEKMTMIRSRIASSELSADSQRPLLTIIERDIDEMQTYIEKNLPEIMTKEQNIAAKDAVESRKQRNMDIESQVQKLSEDFNKLMNEGRYPEAEMIARQAKDLDPNSEIVTLLVEKARFATRYERMAAIREAKEDGNWQAFKDVDEAMVPLSDDNPYVFGNTEEFLTRGKERMAKMGLGRYDSEAEARIWNLLKNQQVQGEYRGTLSEAVEQLSRQAGVNIIFDNIALAAEGVATDRAIDVPIRRAISLQSALNVILGTAGLVFVVEDEVIKVTSTDAQRKDVKSKIYYVGDLVTPIMNFNSPLQMNFLQPGMQNNMTNQRGIPMNGLSNNQMNLTMPQQAGAGAMSPISLAQQSQMATSTMGQQMPGNNFGGMMGGGGYGNNGGPQMGTPTYGTVGSQRLGGVSEADFEPLMELIRTTIAPDDWEDTNGDGTIQAFVPNLSLIVSQTQEVQDQIQDLLLKLRELNDVQIVIEVRFITLTDNFFERIGVDFDFQINDNSGLDDSQELPDERDGSFVIGNGPGSLDLDVGVLQDSFGSAVPQFGGFDVATAANFGFAILSDIEVFFLIQASKGDQRSSIMQAPTVTMFNGQSASVQDGSTRPFVTQVIPVVGDFAVAHQPVITMLPDGTSLNVQAVVSPDRRFVRLTLVPFFSQVTEVETFTFDGTTTTRRSNDSFVQDIFDQVAGVDNNAADADIETEVQGVTVQLPVLSFTTVNTVVNVPDGGTVLMGGIKRMSEGRTERGVPFLSNVPYINRLFKNVGIGRDTSNLMMMVTPRIVIAAEEEARQVGTFNN